MIKNVVFDVGNVLVRWAPPEIVRRALSLAPDSSENLKWVEALFHCATWRRLDRGQLTQAEAEAIYQSELGLTADQTRQIFFHVMDHQDMIEGVEAVARRLKQSGYRIFGLTNNVHEIVSYLKARPFLCLNAISARRAGASFPGWPAPSAWRQSRSPARSHLCRAGSAR
jgi:putative hydrolase of the HAD superfamily